MPDTHHSTDTHHSSISFIGPDQRVVFLKVDTEGNENHVLRGAMPYFAKNLIENAVVEITPGVPKFWEGAGTTPEEVVASFREVATYGYSLVSLHDWTICTTPDEIEKYIRKGWKGEREGGHIPGSKYFQQSDMWLSLNSVEGGGTNQLVEIVAKMKAASHKSPGD